MWPANLPRRNLLYAAISGVLAAVAPFRTGLASEKMTREQAQYQDQPKGISMCSTCTLFEPPKSCKVVEGDVSPNGWCKAFALAD
jgi:hypothetical protein